eukprot:4919945-Prymnesium_polylepis.1
MGQAGSLRHATAIGKQSRVTLLLWCRARTHEDATRGSDVTCLRTVARPEIKQRVALFLCPASIQ